MVEENQILIVVIIPIKQTTIGHIMKYIKGLVGIFVALALSVGIASAQSTTPTNATPTIEKKVNTDGLWRFSTGLKGVANVATPATTAKSKIYGGEVEFGHSLKLLLPGEVGVRQDIAYLGTTSEKTVKVEVKPATTPATYKKVKESVNNTGIQSETKVYYDWQLIRWGNVEFDGGANAGALYGNQTLDWQVSPELDARLFLLKNLNTFVRAEYPFDLNSAKFTGGLVYSAGLQWRF